MNPITKLHDGYVHTRRIRVLCDAVSGLIDHNSRVLDVGSGDGLFAHELMRRRPDLTVKGIDTLVRKHTHVPVEGFDGEVIPHEDASVDVVMFIDVLHHSHDPIILLREAVRVTRKAIVIKDHTLQGFLAGPTLRFMDWVSNAHHGVVLLYNYWSQEKWLRTFDVLGLAVSEWKNDLRLYPWPTDWIFGRSLHFVARLDVS
jgi:SAM-dependent methyltransferase